jgi:hypothetical protein
LPGPGEALLSFIERRAVMVDPSRVRIGGALVPLADEFRIAVQAEGTHLMPRETPRASVAGDELATRG